MPQLHGQVVTQDRAKIGVVASTAAAEVKQPDVVVRNSNTGEEVSRTPQANLPVQQVNVTWEDGLTSTLTEHIDQWEVLGSVQRFDAETDPNGESEGAKAATAQALGDVAGFAQQVRDAAPYAEAARAAQVTVVSELDGGQAYEIVHHDGIGAGTATEQALNGPAAV